MDTWVSWLLGSGGLAVGFASVLCTGDLSRSKARFQGHFGEDDDWEPIEEVRKISAPNAEIHIYPRVGHWFFEADRRMPTSLGPFPWPWDGTVATLGAIPEDH